MKIAINANSSAEIKEYRIEDQDGNVIHDWQESNVFNDVPRGGVVLRARDVAGCEASYALDEAVCDAEIVNIICAPILDLNISDVEVEETDDNFRITIIVNSPFTSEFEYRIEDTDGNVIHDWQTDNVFEGGFTEGNDYVAIVRDEFLDTAQQEFTAFLAFEQEFEATSEGSVGDIQTLTVPYTGQYRITAYGAAGGLGDRDGERGLGAKMGGVFDLSEGDNLNILVGQQGQDSSGNQPSGGGGSFVVTEVEEQIDDVIYRFNEGSGTSTSDLTNNYSDASVSAETLWVLDNITGEHSLDFADVDARVTTPLSAKQEFENNGFIGVSFWVKDRDINNNLRWLGVDGSTGNGRFYIGSDDNGIIIGIGSEFQRFGSLNENEWYHVLFSYDGENARVHLNGQLEGEYNWPNETLPSGNILFGSNDADGGTNPGDFIGDELRVFTNSFILDNVEPLYNNPENFSIVDIPDPLLVAGGAGGYGVGTSTDNQDVAHGHTETWGKDGVGGDSFGEGGTDGNGGGAASDRPGGGGGFFTDGEEASSNDQGRAYMNDGFGGEGQDGSDGGYGGGSAVGNSTGWGACGAGGGYSGGGGGYSSSDSNEGAGGGGGSYNTGTDQENESGVRDGHGKVEIERVG